MTKNMMTKKDDKKYDDKKDDDKNDKKVSQFPIGRLLPLRNHIPCFSSNIHMRSSSKQDNCGLEALDICKNIYFSKEIFTNTVVSEFGLVCEKLPLLPLLTSTYMIGIIVATLTLGSLSDHFGRRRLIVCGSLLHILASWAAWRASDYWSFLISRVLLGSSIHVVFSVFYVLVQESTPRTHRTLSGAVMMLEWNMGGLVLCLLSFLIRDWRDLQLSFAIFSLLLLLYVPFLPESPRWLVLKGRSSEALDALMSIAHANRVEMARSELEAACQGIMYKEEQQEAKQKGWLEVLASFVSENGLRYRLLLLAPVFFAAGLGSYGIHFAIRFFALDIFTMAAIKELANITVIGTLMLVHPKVNRCPSLLAMLSFTGSVLLLSLAMPPIGQGFLLILSQALFSGLYYLLDVYVIEVWPTEVRNFGFNLLESISKTGSALAPLIVDLGGQVAVLAVFGGVVLTAALPVLGLPETRGKALPQTVNQLEVDQEDWLGGSLSRSCLRRKG